MADNPANDFVDEDIPASNDAQVPGWLWITYLTLPFWGIAWFFFFWNGSAGVFDRGAWQQLQQVANTAYPHIEHPIKE